VASEEFDWRSVLGKLLAVAAATPEVLREFHTECSVTSAQEWLKGRSSLSSLINDMGDFSAKSNGAWYLDGVPGDFLKRYL
jgi:hypothetical protein